MTRTSLTIVGFGVLALATVVTAFVLRTERFQVYMASPHDSPVGVAGGSIYGLSQNGWTQVGGDAQTYMTQSPSGTNNSQLYPKGLGRKYDNLPPLSGWVIQLRNRDKDGNTNAMPSAMVCSDPSCQAQTIDSNNIYFRANPNARWTVNGSQLRFHDQACDGSSGTGESQQCDFLRDVTILGPGGAFVAEKANCKRWYGPGYCKIGIGTPPGR
jgi:hypothetical protein